MVSLFAGAAEVQLVASVFVNTKNIDSSDHTKRANSTGHDSLKNDEIANNLVLSFVLQICFMNYS